MDLQLIGRIVAFVLGGGVLFVLQFKLGYTPYIAIPAGIAAYTAVRLAFGLVGAAKPGSK